MSLLSLLGRLCSLHLLMKTVSCIYLPPLSWLPQCLPKRLPSTVQLPHKPTSCFQLLNQGEVAVNSICRFLEGTRAGGGGREEAHVKLNRCTEKNEIMNER